MHYTQLDTLKSPKRSCDHNFELPGGVGEQNPTIHNHWEKIMWTSKFFRHDICRSGGFQTKRWKPWSESALWDSLILFLRTHPHKHLSQILWVLFEQVFNLTPLFSHLLKFIFPKKIFKGWRRSSWPYKCCWSACSGVCRFEKATRTVGEAQVFWFCLFAGASKKMYWVTDHQLWCSLFLFTQLRRKLSFRARTLGIIGEFLKFLLPIWKETQFRHFATLFPSKSKSRFSETEQILHKRGAIMKSNDFVHLCFLQQNVIWSSFDWTWFWDDHALDWQSLQWSLYWNISLALASPYLTFFVNWGNGTLFFLKLLFVVHKTKTSMRGLNFYIA